MLVRIDGELGAGVTPKDVVLAVIGQLGTAGGTGYAIEFAGQVMRNMSVEGRMTVCNMAIEAGARSGMVAYDQNTEDYIKGRPYAPNGEQWEQAVTAWKDLHSDAGAEFDKVIEIDGASIQPQVTWGTSPEMVAPVTAVVSNPTDADDAVKREGQERALQYMDLAAGMPISDIKIDRVFYWFLY